MTLNTSTLRLQHIDVYMVSQTSEGHAALRNLPWRRTTEIMAYHYLFIVGFVRIPVKVFASNYNIAFANFFILSAILVDLLLLFVVFFAVVCFYTISPMLVGSYILLIL